jgi:hypothetical protein
MHCHTADSLRIPKPVPIIEQIGWRAANRISKLRHGGRHSLCLPDASHEYQQVLTCRPAVPCHFEAVRNEVGSPHTVVAADIYFGPQGLASYADVEGVADSARHSPGCQTGRQMQ